MINTLKQAFGVLVTCFLFTAVACGGERPEEKINPYDRLCAIYEEELSGKASPGPETFQILANRVDEEVPELEEQFGHLVNLPKKDFYPMLQRMAEHAGRQNWSCGFIERYYSS